MLFFFHFIHRRFLEPKSPPERKRRRIGLHDADTERRPSIVIFEKLRQTLERLGSKSLALMRAGDHQETEPGLAILWVLFELVRQANRLQFP